MSKLVTFYTSSSTSWTCPAGVTRIWVFAHGGGTGGDGGSNQTFSGCLGGTGTIPYMVSLWVVPNTTYAITIGVGGTGGAPRTGGGVPSNGGQAGDTTFGSLHTFLGGRLSNSTFQSYLGFTTRSGQSGVSNSGYQLTTVAASSFVGSYIGGEQGQSGYIGSPGGTAGAAVSSGTGGNGGSASGFGGGGGAGGSGPAGGGTGGNGAPGQMWLLWTE